ncbi:MAG: cobalamin biosynthesis protein, partial [Blautia massiliensis (ex Durand et al. 2017)]
AQAEGTFASSPFVAQTTGVDNVCERAAVLAGGPTLLRRKTAGQGVTMAVSCRPFELNWRWQDEG